MKSQVDLLVSLLLTFSDDIGYSPSRDILTLSRRIENEGEPFISVTLPHLHESLIQGLRDGRFPLTRGWATQRDSVLPLFLSGFWNRIFDSQGVLLDGPCVRSIRFMRQLLLLFKKEKALCAQEYIDLAVQNFVATDVALGDLELPDETDTMTEICRFLFGNVIGRALVAGMNPKHGPGAVAEKLGTNSRWSFKTISPEAEEAFGGSFFRPNWERTLNDYPSIDTIPARLTAVAKTKQKPRLISIEPSYNQFLQQSLHTALKEELGKTAICGYLSQEPNKLLARVASETGDFATLDLSEASDRVSMQLVERLFAFNPAFLGYLHATRSRAVTLPDGSLLNLNKFASMGSALTFPVETMVFTTIVIYAICKAERNFTEGFVKGLLWNSQDLRIFGDDIIVPTQYYPIVTHLLTACGLKVNESKSFPTGWFKESCGGDYYKGTNVTPVYVRRKLPTSRRHVEEIISWSEMRNQLVVAHGYIPAVEMIDSHLSNLIPYPAKSHDTAGIGRVGPCDIPSITRWDAHLQVGKVRVMVPKYELRKENVHWSTALNKSLRTDLIIDAKHLDHDGRPVAARLNYRWVSVA